MPERFEDAIKALRHIARGNGSVMRIADRIVAAREREIKGVCEPITGELRGAWMGQEADTWMFDKERFTQLCGVIDVVHAQLEREYDELRMKYVNVNRHAEHVERENESLKAELDRVLGEQDNGRIMPPLLDMDDKPINFGDMMVMDGDSELREVVGFYGAGFFAWLNGRYVPCAANLYRHYQPDTWERIIEDAIGEGMARQRNNDSGNFCERANPMNNGDLVARCKALAGEDR